MSSLPQNRRRIYLASPIHTFDSPRYDRMAVLSRCLLRGAVILEARRLFRSSDHWRLCWPETLRALDAIVAFTDCSGIIGAGVVEEILDGRRIGIPVHFLTDDGRLIPLDEVRLQFIPGTSLNRFCRVIFPEE